MAPVLQENQQRPLHYFLILTCRVPRTDCGPLPPFNLRPPTPHGHPRSFAHGPTSPSLPRATVPSPGPPISSLWSGYPPAPAQELLPPRGGILFVRPEAREEIQKTVDEIAEVDLTAETCAEGGREEEVRTNGGEVREDVRVGDSR
ncbi:uncharacterized protein A4U43_C01F30330 [Asparagus officinalis]|uniref:Uncharacterized protein n=1 Tax=Asparagus officinalis TaxID=4686 RepID=A0A5P1FTX7_ASPOF|nr:uncharacterized protein A4U43_C01F30330 [Asparagus officinalis]